MLNLCRHKQPIRRSAFTYCEDELPSRQDLGKEKYGGPFTNEQVEDVKVFVGIVKVLLSLGPVFCMDLAENALLLFYGSHLSGSYFNASVSSFDFINMAVLDNGLLSSLLVVISIPLYICLSRRSTFPNFKILRRLEVGIAIKLIDLTFLLTIDIIAHVKNEDLNCMFKSLDFGSDISPFSPIHLSLILVIQQLLSALSNMLIVISCFEFICAQSPHSMKGMLVGLSYAVRGLFQLIGAILIFPFLYWKFSYPSCGFAYYSMNVVIGLVSFIMFVWVAKRYKLRERDEPSRERQFVEEYYSNIQEEQGNDYSVSISS